MSLRNVLAYPSNSHPSITMLNLNHTFPIIFSGYFRKRLPMLHAMLMPPRQRLFFLKMRIPLKRKLTYFIIGTIGTAVINIIRILSLSLFALIVSANPISWQSFHSIAGEIIFIPWLFIYVYSVLFLENRLARKLQALKV